MPAELSASAVLINYWNKSVNNAVCEHIFPCRDRRSDRADLYRRLPGITIFLILVAAINLGGARFYAEFEFWFASIKVITIVRFFAFPFKTPGPRY